MNFVRNELKKFKKVLDPEFPESSEKLREEEEGVGGDEDEQSSSSRDAFLKITLNFLRRMKRGQLADCLQSSKMLLRFNSCVDEALVSRTRALRTVCICQKVFYFTCLSHRPLTDITCGCRNSRCDLST